MTRMGSASPTSLPERPASVVGRPGPAGDRAGGLVSGIGGIHLTGVATPLTRDVGVQGPARAQHLVLVLWLVRLSGYPRSGIIELGPGHVIGRPVCTAAFGGAIRGAQGALVSRELLVGPAWGIVDPAAVRLVFEDSDREPGGCVVDDDHPLPAPLNPAEATAVVASFEDGVDGTGLSATAVTLAAHPARSRCRDHERG